MKVKPWVGITAGLVAVTVSLMLFAQADIKRHLAKTEASLDLDLYGDGEYTLMSRETYGVAGQWQTAAVITLIFGLLLIAISVWAAIQIRRLAKAGPAPSSAAVSASVPGGAASRGPDGDRRPCPRCGESLARLARVCRFCDHPLAFE